MNPDLLILDLEDLEPTEDGDENELLEGAARAILPLIPDYDPIDEKPLIWQLTEGYLKKKFDELLHPRWPKGTPKGGKFMRKGDVFQADGKTWQVVNAVRGRIEAVEASGDPKKVEHRIFKATKGAVSGIGVGIKGVQPAQLPKGMGKKSPIVKPYVDPSTHDPSVKLPKDSKLTAEQWKRFGKEDQDYYVELMERFGKWDPAVGKSMLNQLYSEYDSQVVHVIQQAIGHSTNVYHSEQPTIMSLANQLMGHGFTGKLGYENVKTTWQEILEATHWDLYNRTKSPDITLLHGGERSVEKVKAAHIDGNTPIFAGFSQSFAYDGASNWGSTILATPTAIRYVGLNYFQGGSNHPGERELALNVRSLLDDRSIVFNSANMGMSTSTASMALRKYLQGETDTQPASGAVIEEIKKVWSGGGSIPIPEEPPGIAPLGGSGTAQFQHLDPAIEKKAGALAHKLKYKSESGSKEGAQGELVGMGLKPGDFIEGQQGTRYIIVADSGDTSGAGLRYIKIEKNGTINYQKSWQFSASAGNNFFRLDGHIDFPKKKEKGFVPFTDAQYAQLTQGEKKPMVKFTEGEMLKVDGEGYKVAGPYGDGSKVKIESLDTGKQFAINGGYKGVPLVPTKDFVPPKAEVDYKPFVGQLLIHTIGDGGTSQIVTYKSKGDGENHLVTLPDGSEAALPLEDMTPLTALTGEALTKDAQPGDTFAHDGKKYTVTNVLKSGIVKAKPVDGHVEKFAGPGKQSSVMPVISELFRPNEHALGDKVKAKELTIGDLVSPSDKKMHPHRVVAISDTGKMVMFRNLETGGIVTTTKQKSWTRIVLPEPELDTETEPKTHTPKAIGKLKLKPVGQVKVGDLEVGDKFSMNSGNKYEVTEAGKSASLLMNDGSLSPALALSLDNVATPVQKLEVVDPDTPLLFDMNKYIADEGTKAVSDLNENDLFITATGIPAKLKSKKPKGGATAVAMHNGKLIKNIPYDKQVHTLTEKESLPEIPPEELKPGDSVPLKTLMPGDKYEAVAGGGVWQIVKSADGPQNPTVSKVLPSGEIAANPIVTGHSGDVNVTFMGHAEKPVEVTPPSDTDPTTIEAAEEAGGFEGYMHHKSGTAKHTKIINVPPGTVFVDKAGNKWMKKLPIGALDIIAGEDGTLYHAPGDAWVKPSDQVPGGIAFTDKSADPALPDSFKANDWLNTGHHSFAELGAEPGDQFTYNGKPFTVFLVQPDAILGESNISGAKMSFNKTLIPPAFKKKQSDSGGTLTSYPPDQLEVGDTFHFANTPSALAPQGYEVTHVEPSTLGGQSIIAKNPTTGSDWAGSTNNLVAVYGVTKGEPDGSEKVKGSELKPGDAFVNISVVTGKPSFDHVYYVTGKTDPETGNPEIIGAPDGGTFAGGQATGQLPPDNDVVKVPTPDWAPPPIHTITKSPPKATPKPPPEGTSGPVTAKGQDSITIDHHLEAKKPAGEFSNFEMALTPQGKWVYQATNGQFFEIGTKNEYKPSKPSVKLTPVVPSISTNLENGTKTTVGDLQPGEFFAFKSDDYVVLAKSDEGSAALRVKDNAVFFNPSDDPAIWGGAVTKREPSTDNPNTLGSLSSDAYFEAHGAVWHKTGQDEAILVKKISPTQMADPGFVQHNWGSTPVTPVPPPPEAAATNVDAPGAVAIPPDTPVVADLHEFAHFTPGTEVSFAGHPFKVVSTSADDVKVTRSDSEATDDGPITIHFDEKGNAGIDPDEFPKLPTWKPAEHGGLAHPEPGDKVFYLDYEGGTVKSSTVQGYHFMPSGWALDLEGGVSIENDDVVGLAPGSVTLEPGSDAMEQVLGGGVDPEAAYPSVLEPYLHPKSGSNKYDKIGTLAPGTKFSDKKHGTYTVVGHFGDQTVYEDEMGQQFVTQGKDRVLVTKAPLIEMRSRLTTAGSFKVYA